MSREQEETTILKHAYKDDNKGKASKQYLTTNLNSRITKPSYNNYNNNKRNFMQRDHHKGAFFQSDPDDPAGTARTDEIYRRDFSSPTGDDKMDKTMVPKVMQVKNFGRRGRTKWTHLVNEDTTDIHSSWSYHYSPLSQKYTKKMGGMDKRISRPKGNKKLKDWEL